MELTPIITGLIKEQIPKLVEIITTAELPTLIIIGVLTLLALKVIKDYVLPVVMWGVVAVVIFVLFKTFVL